MKTDTLIPQCTFPGCRFVAVGECEELDKRHIYCAACGSVVHFNGIWPDRQLGKCSCGTIIEEASNGAQRWEKDGVLLYCLAGVKKQS